MIQKRRRSKKNLAEERRMWAHIMSRKFVENLLSLVEQSCGKCKQPYKKCNGLKTTNFRLRMLCVLHVAKTICNFFLFTENGI